MFGLGPVEIAVVAAVFIILFGPKRLPALARGIAESLGEFRNAGKVINDEIENSANAEKE